MMPNYPSNITRQQFEVIRPELENFHQRTKPRQVDLYDVFCAILYILKNGSQWRALPHDFPKWQTVYTYFRLWSQQSAPTEPSLLDQALKKLSFTLRSQQDRSALTSFIIVDAQSVKNTATAENKGYDAGKKISGIKRHLAVDINGFPQAIHITRANVSDRDGASAMLALHAEHLKNVRSVLVDGGYTGTNFAIDVKTNLKATVQVAKRNELHKFEVLPQRWLVERSFSWVEKCRRLWKNCERQLYTSATMMTLAFMSVLLRRF
ncbi:IS5 family transposase [Levilactobacillus brevis]|uniref:IS5 family transposase n=1 Tax=Lactobacillaceae TaxID=33958 RepID=UPI002073F9B8|nr:MULTISPECIES: IS5 family transposase [Lactobacillaceae]MCT3587265.1 IS5 family transposase [Levilactobacillus brevis]MCW4398465.1 IS5 family transposase [Lentilactobacillus parabuchneri]MDV2565595.1 IS5 family transposase [Levilactobacillus brevis]MDV2584896.1 IS5 family transposase [Levilactobacillus brevis]WED58024.1 IS5 family transposase [Fructilactobacillus sanfranciscensis]